MGYIPSGNSQMCVMESHHSEGQIIDYTIAYNNYVSLLEDGPYWGAKVMIMISTHGIHRLGDERRD